MPGADMAQQCRLFFGEQEDQEEKQEEKQENQEKTEEKQEEKQEKNSNETLFLSTGEMNGERGTGMTGETAEPATTTVADLRCRASRASC